MKVVIQRCLKSNVKVDNKIVGQINNGMMVLVGFTKGDDEKVINYMVDKIINLRIFDDENGVMNKSLLDTKGELLSVSQFTLYGDATKGRRPSYIKALSGTEATCLYNMFNEKLRKHVKTETGIFGAEMEVSLVNDGPVTIIIERSNDNEK